MKILNLVDLDKSDIKYQIQRFPDGQQNIVIENNPLTWCLPSTDKGATYKHDNVQIKSRLNNWLDLELIVCTVAALRELDVDEIHLYTPYVVGTRSDRKFEIGGDNYLKDVICPIINSLNFKTVTVLDPHSDCLEMGIKGFRKESNLKLVNWTIQEILLGPKEKRAAGEIALPNFDNFILISPDAGANKKIYKLAEQISYKGDIITCSKDRDVDGRIIKTIVPMGKYWNINKDAIIIDDICDGGATFINIAKELKSNGWKNKIYLIVTHGIFSKGFADLGEYFDGIYCTNSYSDITFPWRMKGYLNRNSGQLNVF